MTRGLRRRLLLGALAAGVAKTTGDAVRRHHPGGATLWQRANYRQCTVDLCGGPAAAGGLLATALAVRSPSAALVTGAAAALGVYDDLSGHTHARGLRGHAAALRAGVVTSGMVKMVGLVAAAAVAGPSRPRRASAAVLDTLLIAGTANLVNLLDLRPGRALKVVAAFGLPLAVTEGRSGDIASGAAAVALVALPSDLGEQQMLGDCGANALGAAIGWSLTTRLRGASRVFAALAVTGLTVASERMSFTELIERTPALAAIDGWGRRAT